MNDRGAHVLVLGAAGFIGSALSTSLARSGWSVTGLGRSEPTDKTGNLVRIRGSIEDRALLADAVAGCDQIVYCAGVTTPGSSAQDPTLEVTGNLLPLVHVLEVAHQHPGKRFIYLSSGGTVYGDRAEGADEATPLQPRSYYAAGKVAAEALIRACTALTSWDAAVLRPSNVYGPGQDLMKGFAVIPTLFARALDGAPFQVWGNGRAVRDYCYIDDLVRAIDAVLRSAREKHVVFNVSTGFTASVLELVEAARRVTARDLNVSYVPARSVDLSVVAPRSDALREQLGWTPAVDLEEGMSRTWHWARDQYEGRQLGELTPQ